MPAGPHLPDSAAARPQASGHLSAADDGSTAPVVLLSYVHSGARFVQRALAEGTDLACTVGTGILPLCEVAVATWDQIDGRPGQARSRLAISSIRAMVSTQLTTVLAASAGKRRWCELATPAPSAAEMFLQIFPAAWFVCVHRAYAGMMSAAIAAQPWGLVGPAISPFTASYPGNNVAAMAAYWASATERLLTFEAANPQATSRVRYEDVVADAGHALNSVRSSLQLNQQTPQQLWPKLPSQPEPVREDQDDRLPQIPADLIPATLRKRIADLHAQLGYPPAKS
jgi:hypothetical protein